MFIVMYVGVPWSNYKNYMTLLRSIIPRYYYIEPSNQKIKSELNFGKKSARLNTLKKSSNLAYILNP